MSKNQLQKGCILDLTAPGGGVVSGTALMVSGLLVVPQTTEAAGATYAGATEGVWELPKENTAAVFAEGDVIYWDSGAGEFDTTAAGRFPVGTAVAAEIATATTVKVKLKGFAVAAV